MKNVLAVVFAVCLSLLMVLSCDAVPALGLQNTPDDGLLDPQAEFSDDVVGPDAAILNPETCYHGDIPTPEGTVNHAACTGHCLTMGMGFRRGYCEEGVCHCRK